MDFSVLKNKAEVFSKDQKFKILDREAESQRELTVLPITGILKKIERFIARSLRLLK